MAIRNCTMDASNQYFIIDADSMVFVNNSVTSGNHYGVRRYRGGIYENVSYNNVWNNRLGNWSFHPDHDSLPYGVIVTTNDNGDSCDAWNNISVDPMFVDAENRDFHLQEGSPLIDAGDPSIRDPDGSVSDIGAFFFDQRQYPLVDPEDMERLLIYPSPFTDAVTFFFPTEMTIEEEHPPTIEIYSITGRQVASALWTPRWWVRRQDGQQPVCLQGQGCVSGGGVNSETLYSGFWSAVSLIATR